jgi:hypothetical protein
MYRLLICPQSHMKPLINAGILWPSSPLKLKEFVCTQKLRSLEPSQKWAYGSLSTMGKLARVLAYFVCPSKPFG